MKSRCRSCLCHSGLTHFLSSQCYSSLNRLYGRGLIVFFSFGTNYLDWTAADVELWLKKNGFEEEAPLFFGEIKIKAFLCSA